MFTFKEINLWKAGGSFITEPLELNQGGYRITDFLLVSDSAKVLYATPKVGSPLAKAVIRPLPSGFYVTKNIVSNITMEVIDVTQQIPEDFGYASFNIHAVNPLKLSVFTVDENVINLSTATARIWRGDVFVRAYSLTPSVNLISFPGEADATYTLEIQKEGYTTYRREFVYSELIAILENMHLKIYLVPAVFTMLGYVDEPGSFPQNYFQVSISGDSGSINVDWGDGSNTVYSIDRYERVLSHAYAVSGNFPITVTGDLDKIKSFNSFYGQGRMDAIDVRGLTNLQSIDIGLTHGPKLIDLTYNTRLETIFMPNVQQLEHLLLPVGLLIQLIDISGPNQLTSVEVDKIISKVHESVVQHNKTGGRFTLAETWYPETNVMVGPPSVASLIKLRALRDIYQWEITPDPL